MTTGAVDPFVLTWLLIPVAAAICAGLILLLRPLLFRYAIARPNARSSHTAPTPQGGGIAVIVATILTVGIASAWLQFDHAAGGISLVAVFAATAALAVVGAYDDIRPIEAIPRLLLQAIAVIVVIAALPAALRIVPPLPWWFERALLLIAMLWFVNLVNFMDGIDWMTVAEVIPITAGLALFGLAGELPPYATIIAMALCGAIIGFAPFNRPIAKLFLGDVGSLPIGLLLGWLLILLASAGHVAAALLLPLYYIADSSITLLKRLANFEPVTQPHRDHFYQRAIDGGLGVYQIVGGVFVVNLALCALAGLTLVSTAAILHAIVLAIGCVLVGVLLLRFNGGYRLNA